MLWRAKGVDLATIALLLGHEQVTTTSIYREIMSHCVALPWDAESGSLAPPAACGSWVAGVFP